MFASFGRHPGDDVKCSAAWGARAIFSRGYIDLVHDRMQVVGETEEDRQDLIAWVNLTGLPRLRQLATRLSGSDSSVVVFDDAPFHIEASPQSSYGYLYIGAWKRVQP